MSEGDLSPVRRSAWREAPLDQVNPQRRLVPAGPNGPIFSLNGKTERAEMRMAECCSAPGQAIPAVWRLLASLARIAGSAFFSKSDLALGGRSYYRRGRLVGFPNRHFLRSQSCSSYPVAFGCGIGRSESLPRSTGFTIVRPIIAADRVEAHVMVAPVSSRFYPGTGWCCSELDDSAIARASRGRRDKSTGQQFCAHAADPR